MVTFEIELKVIKIQHVDARDEQVLDVEYWLMLRVNVYEMWNIDWC